MNDKMPDIREQHEQLLFAAVKSASDAETAREIVHSGENQAPEDNAAWALSAMSKLEKRFDRATVKKIRMACQCGYGMGEKLALVKSLLESSANMDEFANQERAKAAGLFSTQGRLYLQFPFCPCPILDDVERLDTNTWCQCTTGYSKVLFEEAFGCEVSVELLEAVKMGDARCLMEIIPHGSIFGHP